MKKKIYNVFIQKVIKIQFDPMSDTNFNNENMLMQGFLCQSIFSKISNKYLKFRALISKSTSCRKMSS